jgi:hypothetical protein
MLGYVNRLVDARSFPRLSIWPWQNGKDRQTDRCIRKPKIVEKEDAEREDKAASDGCREEAVSETLGVHN